MGIKPDGEAVNGGVVEEAKQIFVNLVEILKAGNSGVEKLLKVTIFLTDMDKWGEINKLYSELLGEHKCARSVVQVSKLPFGLKMELEATAVSE